MSLVAVKAGKQVRLLIALVVVLAAVGLYMYVFTPQKEQLDKAQAELDVARLELQMSLAKLGRANQAQIDLEDTLVRLTEAYARVSEDGRTSYVLRDLQALGRRHGVVVSNVSFGKTALTGRFIETPFSVRITGKLDDVVLFIEELQQLTQIVTVRSYSLTSGVALPGADVPTGEDGSEAGAGTAGAATVITGAEPNYIGITLELSTYAMPKEGVSFEAAAAKTKAK